MTKKTKFFKPLVWLCIISLYFLGLNMPLLGPDEPRYAQVAREMFERADPITPTLGGFHWFEKPALLYWLQMISYSIFGVSEFSARFGSAIFGLATTLTIWFLIKSSTKIAELAELAALLSATSIGLIVFSHGASFDIILTFPITAALSAFFIAFVASEENNRKKFFAALLAFYVFVGVAVLAKGLVGFVLPFATIGLFFLLLKRLPPKNFLFTFPLGLLISSIVASLWYLPMYVLHGWKFIDEFIIQHHFERYTSNKYLHPQPFWFFWLVLPLMTLPWMPYFLGAVWNLAKEFKATVISSDKAITLERKLQLFALAWILAPLIFFSFSGSKLPGYILPALPATAIITSIFLFNKRPIFYDRLYSIALATVLLIAVGFLLFSESFIKRETVKHMLEKADELGYSDAKILNLHTISHNLEFYGAGRLVRLTDGSQRYFYGSEEVAHFMRENGEKTVLVVVPPRYEQDLIENQSLVSEKISDNGELILFALKLRK